MTAPLTGYRVVELGALEAAAYCGKLFSDFGADVLRIEPRDGDPLRAIAPLVDVGGGATDSAFAAWLNTGKRSRIGDHPAEIDALVASADVVIDGGSPAGAAERRQRWRAANPRLTILSLSWFGETGPYADFTGSDAAVRALAGLVKLTGPVDGPPILLNDHQSAIYTGLTAYTAAVAALYGGGGRGFEVSVLESSIVLTEFQLALRYGPPADENRLGVNKFYPTYPLGIFPCREGWLGVTVGHLDQWSAFCDMLDMRHVETDPRFQTRFDRSKHMAEIDAVIADRLTAKTADEWFAIALERRVPLVVVPDMATLLGQEVHRERGAFQSVTIGDANFEGPTLPLHLSDTPPVRAARAPRPGEGGTEPWASRAGDCPDSPGSDGLPLEGLRILDLSMGWAGPLATRQLADLGADIVKVEACGYPDWWRPSDPSDDPPFELSPWFVALNRNKRDAAIDSYKPAGLALVRRLVGEVDAVIENFAPNVMPKLGLDYAALRAINPSVVMQSMPAYTGRWSALRAYGSTLEHGSGLPSVTGPADGPPVLNHLAYGDPIGGLNGAASLLTALLHRKRTGEGQYVVLSQIQAMLPLAARWIIEQSVTGGVVRFGNRHPAMVPHGVFPTADTDGWIAISVADDRRWAALAELIGLDSSDLATLDSRRAAEDTIERRLSDWTRARGGDAAMAELQGRGIAAGVVRAPGDLYADPHLVARGDWQPIERRYSGTQPLFSAPFREDAQPYPVRMASPTLGEHNRDILNGILGLDDTALAQLEADGVIGQRGGGPRG
ncbi:CoA transferase [Sphingomonas sp.]|uniref:CaiB/BaiF CoA transferase family protein n=1 Tax=Sphingomonas sp. TaxID=28214 RepID=UPI002CE2A0F8|nr:CoA transferase [Sphingomonas sp.]HWK37070.1 CoA transferase [Sphingomonas sp.]